MDDFVVDRTNITSKQLKEINDKNNGQNIQINEVLQNFQATLFNVLSYADKTFQNYLFSNI